MICQKLIMSDISSEEQFILNILKEKEKINYRELQQLCEEEFEGVRLILKKLKERGLVDYEGAIPGFSSEIVLLREPKFPE